MALDTIGVTRAALLTAEIALRADKMRYEHLMRGVPDNGPAERDYKETLDRINEALTEITSSLNT